MAHQIEELQGNVYRVTLAGYGGTELDAAHLIAEDGRLIAVIAEPERRQRTGDQPLSWTDDDEAAFRIQVRQTVEQIDFDPAPVFIQWNPARDTVESEPF